MRSAFPYAWPDSKPAFTSSSWIPFSKCGTAWSTGDILPKYPASAAFGHRRGLHSTVRKRRYAFGKQEWSTYTLCSGNLRVQTVFCRCLVHLLANNLVIAYTSLRLERGQSTSRALPKGCRSINHKEWLDLDNGHLSGSYLWKNRECAWY